MSTALLASARRIAKALTPAERAIDTAILSQAALLAAIVEAGAENDLAAEVNHAAVRGAISSLSSLGSARDFTVLNHQGLAKLRDKYELSADDTGCSYHKLPTANADALALS